MSEIMKDAKHFLWFECSQQLAYLICWALDTKIWGNIVESTAKGSHFIHLEVSSYCFALIGKAKCFLALCKVWDLEVFKLMDKKTHHAVSLHLETDSMAHLKMIDAILYRIFTLNPIKKSFCLCYQFALFAAGIINDYWIILNWTLAFPHYILPLRSNFVEGANFEGSS